MFSPCCLFFCIPFFHPLFLRRGGGGERKVPHFLFQGGVGNDEVQWQEYTGLKRRGDRKSLFIDKRSASKSVSSRAANGRACPPPQTKKEWHAIRDKKVGAGKRVNQNTLGHADAAPAYKEQGRGQAGDAVSHNRRKGKKPEYAKQIDHANEDGTVYPSVGGTQSLDGWWNHGRRACRGVNARYPVKVEDHFREEQWRHWVGGGDRWIEAGKVLAWVPEC